MNANSCLCSLLFWSSSNSELFRTKGKIHLKDRIGSYVTSCLHISAVTWCEQPPDQMASRPVV